MPDHEIKRAGAEALKLASHLAEIVRSSELPPPHWEEVALRLMDLLARKSESHAEAAIVHPAASASRGQHLGETKVLVDLLRSP